MIKNGEIKKAKGTMLEQILSTSNALEAIELYSTNNSNFTSKEAELVEEALFIKLIYEDPLKLTKMLYELNKNKSLSQSEISKILDRQEGGYYETMKSWLEGFEKLGYLEKSAIQGKKLRQVKPRYIYSLNRKYEELVGRIPFAYCCLAENKSPEDSNIPFEYQSQLSLDALNKYVYDINEKLSCIRIDTGKEESFNATKIIHTLLDNGATIYEAFLILDDISKEMAQLTPLLEGLTKVISKEYIVKKVSKALEKKEMYHLLYPYKTENILRCFNFEHTTDAAELFRKKIREGPWNRKYKDEEVYSEVFYKIYGSKIEELYNKEFILLQFNEVLKNIFNKNDDVILTKNDEYSELMKKLALSMLIKIGYLSVPSNPLGSLKNIIRHQKDDEFIKKLKSQESFSEFEKAIKYNSHIIEIVNNEKSYQIKISEFKSNLQKIIQFYEKNF